MMFSANSLTKLTVSLKLIVLLIHIFKAANDPFHKHKGNYYGTVNRKLAERDLTLCS